MRAKPAQVPRAHPRDPAERHHRTGRPPGDQPEPDAPQSGRARMRPRLEQRRQEDQVHPRPPRRRHLAQIVHRRSSNQPRPSPATAPMCAIRAPRRRLPGRSREYHDQPPGPRHLPYPIEQQPPRFRRRGVMAEHHPRPAGQPAERAPQPIAHPLIGHQPQAGQVGSGGLAALHACSYSTAMPVIDDSSPAERLAAARAAIDHHAALGGRSGDRVELIAVSKTRSADEIAPLIAAGHRSFGENRVQEAEAKWPALRAATPGLRLHLVGQLQSNKADAAVALFDAIHSVDRPSLVTALATAMAASDRRPDCFVQVNIGEEPQKGGCAIADLPALLDMARAAGLPLAGLMCVPPADTEAAPYFALLAKLASRHGLAGLSMGMSGDYPTAVLIGATHVRIGTALFGERG
jgi:pyridoxal phosphate enzyme (YggS family)